MENLSSPAPAAEKVPPLSALMTEMGFDKQDLQANRAGKLSSRQIARLQALQRRALLIGAIFFFSLALLATLFIFMGQQNESLVLSLIGMLMTICNAIGTGFFARQWMRLAADLRSGTCMAVRGPLERVIRPNGQINQFVLRISPAEFSVRKEIFKQFRHDKAYALYYTRHAWLLLCAEGLSGGDPTQL